MAEVARAVILLGLLAAGLTGLSIAGAWWFEPSRRLRRSLRRCLGASCEIEAIDPRRGRVAGLSIAGGALAVLWDRGASGLVYSLEEVEGAELIIDGRVGARVMRGEQRRNLDALSREVEQVVLRLMFSDPRFPDFELDLADGLHPARTRMHDPVEAVRSGRRWLAHIDAILRQADRPAPPPARPQPKARPELTEAHDEAEQPRLPLD